MKLRAKLISSFIGVASLIFVIGVVGIFSSQHIIDSFNAIVEVTSPSLNALTVADADSNNMRETAIHHVLQRQLQAPSVEAEEFQAAADDLHKTLLQYQQIDAEEDLFQALDAAANDYVNAGTKLIQLADDGAATDVLIAQIDALDAAETIFNTALTTAIGKEQEDFQSELLTAEQNAQTATTIYIVSMVLVVGAAVALGLLLARSILRPVLQLQHVTDRMMHGDYAQRTPVTSADEIGELSTAFNTMAETIQKRDADLNTINQTLEKRIDERTKELRIATREAQEASRLKDEFLSIMSHELRTPLNAIIGFQGIMLMGAQLDERGKHMIQRAQANSNRLLTLINDILDISRIESGRLQIVKTEIEPAILVDRLHTQMSVLADEKKLDFVVEIDASVPTIISTDEDALTKIITNLLGNAFKFTDEGRITLDLKHAEDNLIIEVTDTGIGIPLHMQQVIFERFRQVDGTSKRAHGGSGLGLAIVQKLCLALGGTIQVESTVGQGSVFTVSLPIEAVAERVAL
ncbi:MAG: HAMP domain-containing protein [Chloroflexi bacterium]|nr:HAMP domain-containing protein [Chloroflexota bacterium]